MNIDDINGLIPAAGEATIIVAVIFATIDIPCKEWFSWAVSCPPSLWQVISLVMSVFIFFVWVLWFVFHRKGNN